MNVVSVVEQDLKKEHVIVKEMLRVAMVYVLLVKY